MPGASPQETMNANENGVEENIYFDGRINIDGDIEGLDTETTYTLTEAYQYRNAFTRMVEELCRNEQTWFFLYNIQKNRSINNNIGMFDVNKLKQFRVESHVVVIEFVEHLLYTMGYVLFVL